MPSPLTGQLSSTWRPRYDGLQNWFTRTSEAMPVDLIKSGDMGNLKGATLLLLFLADILGYKQ